MDFISEELFLADITKMWNNLRTGQTEILVL